MITDITHGMRAFRVRQTSSGPYVESYRISEQTGRKLELVTVVPEYVWEQPKSPYFHSFQLPIKELIDEVECESLLQKGALHPAMTITRGIKT